jgi:hypothetical protein
MEYAGRIITGWYFLTPRSKDRVAWVRFLMPKPFVLKQLVNNVKILLN